MVKPLNSPASFRSISLTFCLSKLFERIILSRRLFFLKSTHFASVFEEQQQRFCGKITKPFLSADIPVCKLNNKHITNLYHDIGHSFQFVTICRKIVLQLSADQLQRMRNFVHYKQIFLVFDESILSGIQFLNILVVS